MVSDLDFLRGGGHDPSADSLARGDAIRKKPGAPRAMRLTKTRFAVHILAAASCLQGCNPAPKVPEKRWNVVLVTVDTLRADKVGAYGGDVPTPHIDRLADEGVLFSNAATVVPLTLPAHSSILTGTYPMYHGVRDNGGYYLGREQVTLAESLRDEGYRTGGFVGAFVLDSRWGLSQGFDRYFDDFRFSEFEDPSLANVQRRGDEVLAEAIDWMKSCGDERFFSWIHFYDPHTPYAPPKGFRTFSSPYDGEVAFVDHLVGELVAWLEGAGLRDRTILVLVGDHGEGLGQHDESEHGLFVYDATIRVPFILNVPGARFAEARVEDQVSLVDVMPTLLDLVGAHTPGEVQGRSALPRLLGEEPNVDRLVYTETYYPRHRYGWSELKSLRDQTLHYIAAPKPELYDVRADPAEKNNLAALRAGTVERLQTELERLESRWTAEGSYAPPAELDADTRRRLEALGYVTDGAASMAVEDRADPKDKIALHNLIEEATADLSAGRLDEAEERLQRVADEDDRIPEVYRLLGTIHTRNGKPAQAAEVLRKALALDPQSKAATFDLAMSYLRLGLADDAMTGLRRVLELDPKDNKSYFLLSRVLIDQRRFEEAQNVLSDALAKTSDHAPFYNLIAECRLATGELDAARAALRTGLELKPDLPRAHFWWGQIFERQGDLDQAREAYEREIEIFPHDYRTFLSLVRIERQRPSVPIEKRITWLERAAKLEPRVSETWAYLSEAYLARNEPQPALRAADRALALRSPPEVERIARGVRTRAIQQLRQNP
jgi:choline-sulfatase